MNVTVSSNDSLIKQKQCPPGGWLVSALLLLYGIVEESMKSKVEDDNPMSAALLEKTRQSVVSALLLAVLLEAISKKGIKISNCNS